MNTLELSISLRRGTDEPEPSEPYVATVLLVDGHRLSEDVVLDWPALFRTLRYDGLFDILTCGCGVPECAGLYDPTLVARDFSSVYWDVVMPMRHQDQQAQGRSVLTRFEFDRKAYRQTIWAAWQACCELLRADPRADIGPHGFDRSQMLTLDAWVQTEASRPWVQVRDWNDHLLAIEEPPHAQ